MKNYRFPVVIGRDKDGWFAMCPDLQGCCTQGDTYEEAFENIKDAIRLHVEDRIEIEVSLSDEDLIEQRRDEPSRPFREFLAEKRDSERPLS